MAKGYAAGTVTVSATIVQANGQTVYENTMDRLPDLGRGALPFLGDEERTV